ncbi:hypothetical protein ACHAW6_002544 [Cyclotella cf. meneghiniana]
MLSNNMQNSSIKHLPSVASTPISKTALLKEPSETSLSQQGNSFYMPKLDGLNASILHYGCMQ